MEIESTFVRSLRRSVDAQWAEIKKGDFWRLVMERPVMRELYRDLMLQVYQYSRHNSQNQAACAFVPAPNGLLKFVYKHASEELGHEKMVTHDLRSIDMLDEADLTRTPLPATEALINYLYAVSLRYGALPRLGYSFWAEGAHEHIKEAIGKMARDLQLTSKNITFFGSHAEADVEHIAQVEAAIAEFATTPEQQELVTRVATTTLWLTGELMNQVARQHIGRD